MRSEKLARSNKEKDEGKTAALAIVLWMAAMGVLAFALHAGMKKAGWIQPDAPSGHPYHQLK